MSDCRKCINAEVCAVDEDCGLYIEKQLTNADRIRSMTNKELADWITGIHLLTKEVGSFGEVSDKWLNWLKEEVVNEDGTE